MIYRTHFERVDLATAPNGCEPRIPFHCAVKWLRSTGFGCHCFFVTEIRAFPETAPRALTHVTDFQIVGGQPVIASARELMVFDGAQVLRLPMPFQAIGILADSSPQLVVKEANKIVEFGPTGWVPSSHLPGSLAGSLHNSGAPVPLAVVSEAGATGFLAFRDTNWSMPIARVQGQLRAVSWNEKGLAAIVGSRLVTWEAGASELRVLQTDAALAEVRDICFLGGGRVLVATRSPGGFSPTRTLS